MSSKANRQQVEAPLYFTSSHLQVPFSKATGIIATKNELFILERIDHPHIIKLYKHFIVDTPATGIRNVYIFMQLAEGESISNYVRHQKRGLPEAICKRLFAQLVSAVNHMHHKGIAHRDLKMGNVLLDKSQCNCLVSDFGLSQVAFRPSKGGTIKSGKYCGTEPYMAPEILLAKEHDVEYDPFAADIWALGVILYCLVNHGYPFRDGNAMLKRQLEHKIKYREHAMTFERTLEFDNLMHALLNPNVQKRIKMDNLMVHPWIVDEVRQIEERRKEVQK